MNRKQLLSVSFLAAACITFNAAPTWAQTQEKSVGGTQSQRTPDSDTPLPKDSPMSGSSDIQKPSGRSQAGQTQEKSVGGTQSQRERESGTPLPGPSGDMQSGSSRADQMQGRQVGGNQWAKNDVKKAQQALKDAGHNPGPIDGVVGAQTQQAIKEFQSSSGLKQTGTLDAETAQKLGIQRGDSSSAMGRSTPSKRPTGASDGPSSSQRESSSPMGK
ncbi:MAG TPA: peptidoglycan-binding domain-containing protein [Candidatus Binatia bacterium]|nr:peptidoglycan-binding domain-containing protein [Candidatus Binatia bacterium]